MQDYAHPQVANKRGMMSPPPLTRTIIALHWIVASSIVALWGFGFWMARTQGYYVFSIHESLGLIALPVIAWRAVRRIVLGLTSREVAW